MEKSKCESGSHRRLKEKTKNRVTDLEGMLSDLKCVMREGRMGDAVVIVEQMHQMRREWEAELNEPSPVSSLLGGSLGPFSAEIERLLHLNEEQDDATSVLAEPAALKPEPDVQNLHLDNFTTFQEEYFANGESQEHSFQGFDQCKGFASGFQGFDQCKGFASGFQGFDQCKGFASGLDNTVVNNSDLTTQLDYYQFELHQDFDYGLSSGADGTVEYGQDTMPNILPNICPPPSDFLGPKCALWDCARPAQGSEWCQDYCSSVHADLALKEGPPGMTPVLRPKGISVKDDLLFAALSAKMQGKDVGIPECEGAATTRCPWNAQDLFDLSLLQGETIREWLFFDKPRRAFESGNRKQRSLPDYSGRGWHESRKQVMKEYGGQRRSYYMDPQPQSCLEWHLYEYEINSSKSFALYRLELKLVDEKKSPRGKVNNDSLADLQKKMGRLTAEVPADNRHIVKCIEKANEKPDVGNVDSAQTKVPSATETPTYSLSGSHNHLADNLNDLYCT